ncbi:MAG: NTP transferase domain-containing protein, partial [Candidatus Promineifilaceae bacterium]
MRSLPPHKVVIPMAGQSRRFQAAGYAAPKPFIPIDGKMMIERVCRLFSAEDEFVFVCNEEQLQANPGCGRALQAIAPRAQVVAIAPHELGPVYTAIAADEYIGDDEAVIIAYCDFSLRWSYRQFLLQAAQYDGAMAVFRGFHPASFGDTDYCYLRVDENLELLEVGEKRPFTAHRADEYASTGVYYFGAWRTFRHYAEELVAQGQRVGGEYYASLIYPAMLRDGKRVCVQEVEKFICWGTPQD